MTGTKSMCDFPWMCVITSGKCNLGVFIHRDVEHKVRYLDDVLARKRCFESNLASTEPWWSAEYDALSSRDLRERIVPQKSCSCSKGRSRIHHYFPWQKISREWKRMVRKAFTARSWEQGNSIPIQEYHQRTPSPPWCPKLWNSLYTSTSFP